MCFLLSLLLSFSVHAVEGEQIQASVGSSVSTAEEWFYEAEKTLPQGAGRLIITGFEGIAPGEKGVEEVANLLVKNLIGGLIFFNRNIVNPEQLKNLIAYFKGINPDVLIAIDGEGGYLRRLPEQKGFNFCSIGNTALKIAKAELKTAKEIFIHMAKTLADLGFNVTFAPVLDLHHPNAQAIGKYERAFSEDSTIVAEYAGAFVDAHHMQSIVTCGKHWTGQGFIEEDSHFGIADATKGAKPEELEPYRQLQKQGKLDMVMMGHIMNKNIDPDWPASLSSKAHELLRKEIGFEGLIVSDDLQMGAIKNNYTVPVAVEQALNAGTDILLFAVFDPEYLKAAWKSLTGMNKMRLELSLARLDNLWKMLKGSEQDGKVSC